MGSGGWGEPPSGQRIMWRLVAVLAVLAGPAQALDRQTECIARAVYWEARGLSQDGMRAVVEVIRNRTRHPSYPKTPCGVVYQRSGGRCQFSWTCGPLRNRMPPNNAEWQKAQVIARQPSGNLTNGAIFFHATYLKRRWRHLEQVAEIDSHVFYSERK